MPRENKNRGRREEKKLKRKAEAIENVQNKRQKAQELLDQIEGMDMDPAPTIGIGIELGHDEDAQMDYGDAAAEERPFYGMLEDQAQEYFRRADEMLELNDFPSAEDRSLFLDSVFREAEGQELKIACSQSCSRLMERLILLSTVEQKKNLFEKFADNFTHLVQHRFASHCCEMLFIQSAGVVTDELLGRIEVENETDSMEALFLRTLDELEGDMTALLTSRHASHTLRVLLVVLSGRPLEKSKTLMQSKRKERISVTNLASQQSLSKRPVPESFHFAVSKIISDTIATMNESFIVVLAQHRTGNPTLQLLLELELTSRSKASKETDQKTLFKTLLPDDISATDSKSQKLINGLMYDAVGSRLLETICTFAPSKSFKQIYRNIFKDRIASLARNETASYVVITVMKRLSPEDLEEAVTAILPQIGSLVERNRTILIKTLVERCYERGVDIKPLTEAISAAYGSDPNTLLLKLADITDLPALTKLVLPQPITDGHHFAPQTLKPTPPELHGSLLAQALLAIPGPSTALLQTAILTPPPSTLHTLALYTPTSHILQSALGSAVVMSISGSFKPRESPIDDGDRQPYLPTRANLTFRRKLINLLIGPSENVPTPILMFALSNIGTHILDSILLSAPSLFSLVERVASILSTHEYQLRDSFTGRIVWRNWHMDLHKRRYGDWVNTVKTIPSPPVGISTQAPAPAPVAAEGEANPEGEREKKKKKGKKDWKGKVVEAEQGPTRTPLELAREKHFAKQAQKLRMKEHKGTGVNAIAN